MGADITQSVKIAVEVEDADFPAGNPDNFAAAGREVGGVSNNVTTPFR
jgi:hypothetical protein